MRKALEKAVAPAERYHSELCEANRKLHENAWCATEQSEVVSRTPAAVITRDIATSTTNLIHLTTNGTNPNDDSADRHQTSASNGMDQDQPSFDLIEHLKSLANDCDQYGHAMQQTKSIIEDNINLRIR